jgi:hypothetical protein
MANFAKIDAYNTVTWVVVVPDEEQHRGQQFLNDMGLDGRWILTPNDGSVAKGDIYDEVNNIFTHPNE